MMRRLPVLAALSASLVLGVGVAWAQDTTPPPSNPPPAASSKMSPADKVAIAKSCIEQANAKGLHGKARRKFKTACKHRAAKANKGVQ